MRRLNNEELDVFKHLFEVKGKKLNVAIYARKSRDDEKGTSLKTQVDSCKEMIGVYPDIFDLNSVAIYEEDNASGFSLERNEFKKVLKKVKNKEINVLVTINNDRITRSIEDFAKIDSIFKKNMVMVLTVDSAMASSADDKMFQYIGATINQFMTIKYIERGIEVKRNQFEQGLYPGGAPNFGYKIVKRQYYQDENEAPAVKLIYQMVINGRSYAEIVKELQNRGYEPRGGGRFAYSHLKDIITNERNYGKNVFMPNPINNKRHSNKFYKKIRNDEMVREPIISKTTYDKANRILKSKAKGRQSKNRIYLLTGLLFTEDTNDRMSGNSSSSSKGRTTYYSYQKTRASDSVVSQINAIDLEMTVIEVVKKLVNDYKKKNGIKVEYINKKIKEIKSYNVNLARLSRERVKSTEKLVEKLIETDKEVVKKAIENSIAKNEDEYNEYQKAIRRNNRLIKKYEALKKKDLLNIEITKDVLKGAQLKELIHAFIKRIIVAEDGSVKIETI